MTGSPRRKILVLSGLLAVAILLFAFWGFRQVVPAGLRLRSVEPFFFWSRDLGTFSSADGTHEVRVIVNDGGAMHSGNHWVWVISFSPITGQRILAEGYVGFEDTNRERLPLRWISQDEIAMTFRQGRHSSVELTTTFAVP
jgi:hypothetical protein